MPILDEEVIVISSDDESWDSATIALRKAKSELLKLKKRLLSKEASDNQILSDQGNNGASSKRHKAFVEEAEHLGLKSGLDHATAQITKLQSALRIEKEHRTRELDKIQKLRKRAAVAETENANLKALNQELLTTQNANRGNNSTNMIDIEHHINCEICQEMLWHPHTLVECGHTICQGCLTDWFSTAIVADPHQPRYQCPKCRTPVYHKPIEDFTLKALVRAVAHVIDSSHGPPPAPPPQIAGYGPWYRYFGR